MQTLHTELETEGHNIDVAVVNQSGAQSSVSGLTSVCDFDVFQDMSSVNAWGLHGGGKDDIIIYNSDGTVSSFLEYGGAINTSLGSPSGYANVKAKILEAY